ncbi:MAG: alanine racemase [Acidimicrobiia bacterium]
MKEELPLWAEIDLGAIRRNVEAVRRLLKPETKLLSVVKANGYGHGDVQVAKAAVAAGSDWLGVARVEEGATLRTAGVTQPILLLAEPPLGAVERAIGLDLVPTLYSEPVARAFSKKAAASNRSVTVHMKVDTGMHRYGVLPERALSFFKMLRDLDGIDVRGIWSHFAAAENEGDEYTRQQYESFIDVLGELNGAREGLMKHMANSAATVAFPNAHFDMVRCGIVIYGIHPAPELEGRIHLEPAMTLKSRVGFVKRLAAGESLSYGRRYFTSKPTNVATVPYGYADGLTRALSNKGEVLIRGRRYPICGAITMDHFLVDVGDDEVASGDEVVIMGKQLSGEITAQEIANLLDTIPYEIVCAVSSRVPRIYIGA